MTNNEKSVILITGAASGFGRAVALQLIEEGHTVFPADLSEDTMQDMYSLGARPLAMDVTDPEAIRVGVENIIANEGRIDVLVNNAGYALYDIVESCPINQARAEFEVNFWGPAMLIQAVLPHMRKAHQGRIVNTSSAAGRIAGPMTGWYSASKFAIEAFSDALRIEVGQFGIQVSIVEPGTFKTGFGGVVTSHFDEITADPDYESLIQGYVTRYVERQELAPTPEPVIEAMMDAIRGDNPQTRYLIGEDAETAVAAKASMHDEAFDDLMKDQFGIR